MSEENSNGKKNYNFGELKEYDLEKIEQEVLKESVYLDVFAGSDLNFKEDVQALDTAEIMNKLKNLNAYAYNYKTNEFPQFSKGKHFGLMAHEVESAFPQLVKKDEESRGYANYQEMIPLLVGAINSINERVKILEERLQ